MKKISLLILTSLVFFGFCFFYSQPSKAQISPQTPRAEAGKVIFGKGDKSELEKAKQISLEILNRQSLNRSVGTVNDLKVEKVEIDELQMAHTRVQQMVDDIPVWEGEAIVHLKSDGSLFTITDNLKESIEVNTKPSISADEAVRIADGLYKGTAKATDKPKVSMWIYRGEDKDYLTYRVEIPRIDGSNATAIPVDFIDAHTGKRIYGYNNLQTGTGLSLYSGTVTIGTSSTGSTFYLENLTRKVGTFNFNNGMSTVFRFTDTDDIWNSNAQRAGVDAQYGAEATINYYQSVHNRNGIDGNGGPDSQPAAANSSIRLISSLVHYGNNLNEAFWNGSYMTYGDGDGSMFSPLVSLDICGHEMTHGVTQFTANLTYANESGALNESMSDVFGVMVERYARPTTWNWKHGEDAYTPGISGDAARYMDNPTLGNQPDNYVNRYIGNSDNGGVHINSGIGNNAFYLIAQGGTNRVSGVTVQGIGPDDAAKIWYKALTMFMMSGTNFSQARTATLNAATALFGASSPQYNSVATGWCAVGVGLCPGGGTCPTISLSPGQTINGSLATTDCTLADRGYVDTYTFNGTAGQRVAVSMNSSAFDSYLYLINSSNQIIAENDDGGGGTNSRIPATSGFFTLPTTGTYSIYATSFEANKTGAYSITLTSDSGGQCPIIPINFGQTINGALTTSDCVLTGTTKYADSYTFNGTSGQQIAVSMNSAAIDSYLFLYNPSNQKIAENDDGGGGKNSRIPATSGFFTLPATGTYTIIASSFGEGETGAYTISLSASCSYSLNQTSQSFSAAGGNGSVNVSAGTGCAWSAASNVSWITANGGGTGNGAVTFSVAANTGLARTGTITIAGQTFTVNQAGGCSYSLSSAVANVGNAGGNAGVNVSAGEGCTWNVVNNNSWITVTSGGIGTGNRPVAFSVTANSGQSRTGTMTVAGQTFTVNQASAIVNTRTAFDFDGDGKADMSVFRPSNGTWYLQQSANGFTGAQFGISSDKVVSADYDGDGKTDIAVYRGGTWYINRSQLGFTGFAFGDANDIPQPADFDGDGKAELVVFRPSNGTWYVFNLANNQFNAAQFGVSTDKPVASDYDGDGKADFAVFRPSNGTWYLQRSTAGFTGIHFGEAADKPVAADYDGDGKTDVAVFRPSNGTWYLLRSQAGFTGVQFGISTDLPTPADYDGDGKADVAVFRSGNWYLNRSTAGFTGVQFGAAADKPVPNAFVP